MNPTAIFSKSGKGVQEASGKTSSLSRGDRAVLSAIDGRATLGDVAGKVGKEFDNDFKSLINKLDKDGFIREVSPGAASSGPASKQGAVKPAPSKPAPSKPTAPTAPMDVVSDLDFTSAMAAVPKKGAAAPPPQALARAPAPPPKPTVAVPPKPPPPSAAEQAKQAQIAKDQQSAFARAREEAEQKAAEQRDRLKAEAEAKVRAETESKLRAEAEERAKADAEARAKKAEVEAAAARSAAIRAAAEAKVKAEAEAKRAREEAERARQEAERAKREAEEKAVRARKEAEEKARREQEELKRKLEEERRAREEAERKAKEEAERARREQEELKRKLEEERKAREEESRREEEERAARRKREEEEEQERRTQREVQEAAERAEKEEARKRESEEPSFESLMAAQAAPPEAPRKGEPEEPSFESLMAAQAAQPAAPPPPPPAPKKAATGDAFADSLLADLDSFTQRDDEDRKAKEETDRKAKEEVARRKQEEAEHQEREAAEIRQRAEDARRKKEEEAQRAREEEERRARKAKEEQEQIQREAEERQRKIAAASGAAAPSDDIGITDDDLQLDEVKQEAALLEKKKDRKAEREKEREKERALKKERDREAKSKKEKEKEEKEAKKSAAAYTSIRRRKSNLGRNLVLGLLVLAVIGVGVVHVMPVSTGEYETAATEAIGRPVKIGAGRFSLIGGVQYKFDNVNVGGLAIPTVRAFPELGSVLGDKKVFTRIELEGMTLPQDALGEVLFGKVKSDRFHVERVVAKNLKLAGALPLPVLEADVVLEGGGMRTATLRGGEGLVAKLTAKEASVDFEVNTSQFTLPFAPEITLVQFAMKGEATRAGMKVASWDGLLYSGHMTGQATVRWGNTWTIDGVLTARGVNAAVFAPALLSNGRGEGSGRFSMSGVEPARLGSTGRLEGNFMVIKGVLGSFDLSRALQTGGRQVTGQTQFAEMSGQAVYDRGEVTLRNINLSAGALNAGASADISASGALSGRIIADVRTSAQNLRATLVMGGTVKEPQVK